jgi:hypothetical protein
MLKFVEKAFRGFFEVFLWIILIGGIIGGGIIGNALSGWGSNYTFLGVIIGSLVGLIIVIVGGGLVATFLNINKNLEQLVQNEKQNGNFSFSNNKVVNENTDIPASSIRYSGNAPSLGEVGDEYIVTINTALRGDPVESSYIVKPLKTDDKVYFQYAVDKSNWFYVNTSDSKKGWCFAGHLKKA